MKQIRNNIFETNSSSCHSLSISHRNDGTVYLPVSEDGFVHVSLGEYGWGYDKVNSSYEKLKYLLTQVANSLGYSTWYDDEEKTLEERQEQFAEESDFQLVEEYLMNSIDCEGIIIDDFEGYVDHQSCEGLGFIREEGIAIDDYLFNPNITVIIDNDNH